MNDILLTVGDVMSNRVSPDIIEIKYAKSGFSVSEEVMIAKAIAAAVFWQRV
jgi:hypothetical protein